MGSQLAAQAERKGTYVHKEVTKASLEKFYSEHEQSKLSDVPKVVEKYGAKPAKLVRLLKKKYGAAPAVTDINADKGEGGDEGDDSASIKKRQEGGSQKRNKKKKKKSNSADSLASLSTEDLRAELSKRTSSQDVSGHEDEEDYPFVLSLPASMATEQEPAPVVILGGVPAGLTAAIYCARAGLRPIVVAPAFGGQLLGKGVDVENFPGVMGAAATGRGIVQLMRKQASALLTTMVDDVAVEVRLGKDGNDHEALHQIKLNGTTRTIYARSLIVATGADSR